MGGPGCQGKQSVAPSGLVSFGGMNCPSCANDMTARRLDAHLGRNIDIDVCRSHAFWFDPRESLQLAPASTLQLFTVIGETSAKGGRSPRS